MYGNSEKQIKRKLFYFLSRGTKRNFYLLRTTLVVWKSLEALLSRSCETYLVKYLEHTHFKVMKIVTTEKINSGQVFENSVTRTVSDKFDN